MIHLLLILLPLHVLSSYIGLRREAVEVGNLQKRNSELQHWTIGKVHGFFSKSSNNSEIDALKNSGNLISLEADTTFHIFANTSSWALDRIDQRNLPLNNTFTPISGGGRGITIYLFDSGCNTSLSDFNGRAQQGPDLTSTGNGTDDVGHGTFVASLIIGSRYGVARNASLYSIKTISADGSGAASVTLRGILSAVNHWNDSGQPPSIFHFSIGAPRLSSFDTVINSIRALGLAVVSAAGNDADDACLYSPGSSLGSITVAAIDSQDQLTNFTNIGPCVSLFAPGENITSVFANGTVGQLDGTSFAAPLVTGSLALYWTRALNQGISLNQSLNAALDSLGRDATNNVVKGLNFFSKTPNSLVYVGTTDS